MLGGPDGMYFAAAEVGGTGPGTSSCRSRVPRTRRGASSRSTSTSCTRGSGRGVPAAVLPVHAPRGVRPPRTAGRRGREHVPGRPVGHGTRREVPPGGRTPRPRYCRVEVPRRGTRPWLPHRQHRRAPVPPGRVPAGTSAASMASTCSSRSTAECHGVPVRPPVSAAGRTGAPGERRGARRTSPSRDAYGGGTVSRWRAGEMYLINRAGPAARTCRGTGTRGARRRYRRP